jgi:hypothetical protein
MRILLACIISAFAFSGSQASVVLEPMPEPKPYVHNHECQAWIIRKPEILTFLVKVHCDNPTGFDMRVRGLNPKPYMLLQSDFGTNGDKYYSVQATERAMHPDLNVTISPRAK